MGKTLGQMIEEVRALNTEKGWRLGDTTLGDHLALIGTELSEAVEAYRDHRLADATGPDRVPETIGSVYHNPLTEDERRRYARPAKPEGVGSEFGDVLIRLVDTSDIHGLRLFDGDMELGDVAPLDMQAVDWPCRIETFGEHITWLHGCVVQILASRTTTYALRALVTVAEHFGIDLAFEYERKMAFNWTRPYQHGGRTLSDAGRGDQRVEVTD